MNENTHLSNTQLELTLSGAPAYRLDRLALRGEVGAPWIDAAASRMFAVVADGETIDATSPDLTARLDCPADGTCVARLAHAASGLEIEHHLLLHADSSVIEAWLTVRNTGERTAHISRLDSLSLDIAPGEHELLYFTSDWGAEFEPVRAPLAEATVIESRTGRSSHGHHPWMALFRAGGGIVSASVAWSGNWILRLEPRAQGGWRLSGGLHDWAFGVDLQPGQTIEAPRIAFVLGSGDDLNAASTQYARVGRRAWIPPTPLAQLAPVEWNHWWSYEDKAVDEATFRANVDAAADMGIEVCTLDAGWFGPTEPASHWYDYRGDWDQVNSVRFPSGIRALSDYTHRRGMKFGLWCEIEGLGRLAHLARARPDFPAERDGARLGYVCLGNPAAQAWAYATLSRLVTDFGADWIKLDFNLDPGAGCARTDHGHGRDDGLFAHYRGYYHLLERLRAAHPDVVWENCSSGGQRIDLGLMRHTPLTFLSDPDWPEHALQLFWGASTMLPPSALLRWTYSEWVGEHPHQRFNPRDPNLHPHELDYFIRIAMLSVMGLSQRLPDLPAWVRQRYAEHIELYKSLVRPFVRQADLYRLTSQPKRDGGDRWAAFQYALPSDGHNLLFAFRLLGAEPRRAVKLRALAPDADYSVTWLSLDRRERLSGRQLMVEGIAFDDLRERDSALLLLEPVRVRA